MSQADVSLSDKDEQGSNSGSMTLDGLEDYNQDEEEDLAHNHDYNQEDLAHNHDYNQEDPSHNHEDLANHPLFKTEICRNYNENGTCQYGDHCQFAHGRDELRIPVVKEKKVVTSRPVFKLFIDKLPLSINESGVGNIFREFGEILYIYINKTPNRSTNWAKVSFATKDEANNAIKKVNGQPPLFLHVKLDQEVKIQQRESTQRKEFDLFSNWRKIGEKLESKKQSIIDALLGDETDEEAEKIPEKKPSTDLKTKPAQNEDIQEKDDGSNHFTFGTPLLVPYIPPEPCVQCSKSGKILCSRCHAWYCSQACQINNWPTHREGCQQILKVTTQREGCSQGGQINNWPIHREGCQQIQKE